MVVDRTMATQADHKDDADRTLLPFVGPETKLTSVQRFKLLFKKYWYVLVPVHLVTSAFWFGTFYYMAVSGIDIVGLLHTLNVSDTVISKLNRAPNAGHIALAYGLFKLASPVRYPVTVAVTAISVRYLVIWGWIKPAPTRAQVRTYVDLKKRQIRTRVERWRSKTRAMARKTTERRKSS
ncbi:unnamed protein product [Soboliphyme baturini]|uniref:DUF1279 domain-containing protein n=1 Tax=Soboliphyme baturini TaxID=241478 RepID=A0A183J169_9BILA|nr:unnamed protein product [Soboliphyme baturini]